MTSSATMNIVLMLTFLASISACGSGWSGGVFCDQVTEVGAPLPLSEELKLDEKPGVRLACGLSDACLLAIEKPGSQNTIFIPINMDKWAVAPDGDTLTLPNIQNLFASTPGYIFSFHGARGALGVLDKDGKLVNAIPMLWGAAGGSPDQLVALATTSDDLTDPATPAWVTLATPKDGTIESVSDEPYPLANPDRKAATCAPVVRAVTPFNSGGDPVFAALITSIENHGASNRQSYVVVARYVKSTAKWQLLAQAQFGNYSAGASSCQEALSNKDEVLIPKTILPFGSGIIALWDNLLLRRSEVAVLGVNGNFERVNLLSSKILYPLGTSLVPTPNRGAILLVPGSPGYAAEVYSNGKEGPHFSLGTFGWASGAWLANVDGQSDLVVASDPSPALRRFRLCPTPPPQ